MQNYVARSTAISHEL